MSFYKPTGYSTNYCLVPQAAQCQDGACEFCGGWSSSQQREGWEAVAVIFAVILLAIAIWEHLNGRNVPASLLIGSGVAFFCFGSYKAWGTEKDAKDAALKQNEAPHLVFSLEDTTWTYDSEKDKTVLFIGASLLNKGYSSAAIGWRALYWFGSESEIAEAGYPSHSGNPYIWGLRC